MSRVVGLGAAVELLGYELVGVDVVDARGSQEVPASWAGLGDDVALVLLTQEARQALPDGLDQRDHLWVVLP
jgi:vacuolar-type H+-ATPase subunit F/Vma7